MISAVRRVEQGPVGWWRLHIEGSCDAGQKGAGDRAGSCDCIASYIRVRKKSVVCGKELLWEHPAGASLGESEEAS